MGVEKFGQHAARNYFTWTDFSEETIKNLDCQTGEVRNLDIFRQHEGFSFSESIKHNVLIQLLLATIVEKKETLEDLQKINRVGFVYGDPPRIESNFGLVTLDLLSSIIEIDSLREAIEIVAPQAILEIGAGSGRTANALLELNSQMKYVIADIPPALFVGMTRLKKAFPNKKIFFVDDKSTLEEYLAAPDTWDVLFALPSLLTYFPNKFFEITLAIDCLHEMNEKMRNMFADIATSKSKYYYFKIWNKTTIPLDNIFLTSTNLSDFGYSMKWKVIFSKNCKFPANFSEHLFLT